MEVGGGTIVLVVVASPRWETSVRLRTSLQALVVNIDMSLFLNGKSGRKKKCKGKKEGSGEWVLT